MASGDEGPSAHGAALLAPLQWISIGCVLSARIIAVEFGRWSLQIVGLLVLAWGAHTVRTASSTRVARALWTATIVACLSAALLRPLVWESWPLAAASEFSMLVLLNAIVWGLSATTREYGLPVARRWTLMARMLAPFSLFAGATEVLAWNVGSERPFGAPGAYVTIANTELTLPEWAWPVVLVGMVPVLALCVWGIALFVSTYRQAKEVLPTPVTY